MLADGALGTVVPFSNRKSVPAGIGLEEAAAVRLVVHGPNEHTCGCSSVGPGVSITVEFVQCV